MKIKERIKKYFTEKPKQNFWFWAFITLLIFRYITPTALLMLIPLQIGLIAPDTTPNYDNISINVANNIVKPLENFNRIGADLGHNNPLIAKIIFYTLNYCIYAIWVAMFFLIINLIRYGISGIIKKMKRKKK